MKRNNLDRIIKRQLRQCLFEATNGVNSDLSNYVDNIQKTNLNSTDATSLNNSLNSTVNGYQGKLRGTQIQNNGQENEKQLKSNRIWNGIKDELAKISNVMNNVESKTGGDVSDDSAFGFISRALMNLAKQAQIGITQGQTEQRAKGGYNQSQVSSQMRTQQNGITSANNADNKY